MSNHRLAEQSATALPVQRLEGAQVTPLPLPFAVPDIGEDEIEAVVGVMRSGWLTTGRHCRQFEEEFAEQVGAKYAVAVSSCTAALHLSLESVGVVAGDLVFMSPYTFASTAEVVRYLGATPVFVDIDPSTLNIDVGALRRAVDAHVDCHAGQPRAIIPVHVAGVPCQMDTIWDVARETGLAVIEDAAHAFPSRRHGVAVGAVPEDLPATACFSFYATKTITTGEGGMVTTDHKDLADRIRTMSLHGLSRQAWTRYTAAGSWWYDIVAPGYKYNLSDMAAAMGRVQLSRAEQMLRRRREIAQAYTEALSSRAALECPTVPPESESAWHLYVLRVNEESSGLGRDEVIKHLSAEGVGTSVHFIPLHLHSYYREQFGHSPEDFPVATREYSRALSLPLYSKMSDGDVSRVVDAVRAITA